MSTDNQRSCLKCKSLGHIVRDCTYSNLSAKKAGVGGIVTAPRGGARKDSTVSSGPALEVTVNHQSEIKDGMLRLASGKAVAVMKDCAVLEDLKRTKYLCVPILRRREAVEKST
ncbi:hypothetical protein PoB_003436700 [Plakobranchus ocellatus]|uniref:CCHC-type domain-containing protein n=1 Tax=Plakobranchus ocellatus TaxID=259542 RepID=A0AAV4ALI3_9GAST|nr:hypothetical protein PoB_003436700 [Plakobranchus ocellatus]